MFEGRFGELLIIFVLALIVLGPEKLPRVVSEVGRWVGRARAMARQFREQLEEEVILEENRKAQAKAAQQTPEPPPAATAPMPPQPAAAAGVDPPSSAPGVDPAPAPPITTPDTYSAAHPTDEHGANPLHPTGAADEVQLPGENNTPRHPPVSSDPAPVAHTEHRGGPATGYAPEISPQSLTEGKQGSGPAGASHVSTSVANTPDPGTLSSHERGT
jgi:sec-independent protein translocase protein TatB